MPYDDKTIQDPERDRWKDQEVDCRDAVGMVAQKRAPALRWWPPRVAAHIPSDCRLVGTMVAAVEDAVLLQAMTHEMMSLWDDG